MIRGLDVGLGDRVEKGQVLFVIESDQREGDATLARIEIERLRIELAVIESAEERRALLPLKTEELVRATAKLESTHAAIESNRILAEIDGTVVEWDERVRNGMPIARRQPLGKIVTHRTPGVVCYVRQDLILDIEVSDRVDFVPAARPGRCSGVVQNVDPVRTTYLEHHGLSSVAGGQIAVVCGGRCSR